MHADADAWRTFQQRLAAQGERRLVLLSGDRQVSLAWLAQCLAGLNTDGGIWFGPSADRPATSLTTVSQPESRHWLGSESSILVWDGWHGNPPDALAILTGTLAAGGLWFWLMPDLADWPWFADPDYVRTGLETAPVHPFAQRMARCLAEDASVIRGFPARTEPPVVGEPGAFGSAFEAGITVDQQRAIRTVEQVARGRRRRPLVITADRGRGKSAALGMAAMAYLQETVPGSPKQILVTAPTPAAVRTLFWHARQQAGGTLTHVDDHKLTLGNGSCLRFEAVDQLVQKQPEAALVLVDEAAAIPAPRLQAILLGWPRVVFASTVHGYEGAGRGFTLRFRQVLDRYTPQWRQLMLAEPIRWSPGDPLEALVNRLFLLDAEAVVPAEVEPLTIAPWQPSAATEAELAAAFGLLVNAHYRTTPGDVRQWLDDPVARTWVARVKDTVVGVLWSTVEGGFDPSLAAEVMAGRRRLRGHLLPQSLAHHSGVAEAASARSLRVVRVAVSEHCRRQGVAMRLITAARQWARDEGLDAVGASFGASSDLLAFWRHAGAGLLRLGLTREASSGEYAAQVMAPTSPAGKALVKQISTRFADSWQTLLPVCWPDLAPELVVAITAWLPPAEPLEAADKRELAAFCQGHRGFELSLLALQRLSRQPGVASQLAVDPACPLWCRLVLQGWRWPQVQAAGDCEGRRHGEGVLRRLASAVMACNGDGDQTPDIRHRGFPDL